MKQNTLMKKGKQGSHSKQSINRKQEASIMNRDYSKDILMGQVIKAIKNEFMAWYSVEKTVNNVTIFYNEKEQVDYHQTIDMTLLKHNSDLKNRKERNKREFDRITNRNSGSGNKIIQEAKHVSNHYESKIMELTSQINQMDKFFKKLEAKHIELLEKIAEHERDIIRYKEKIQSQKEEITRYKTDCKSVDGLLDLMSQVNRVEKKYTVMEARLLKELEETKSKLIIEEERNYSLSWENSRLRKGLYDDYLMKIDELTQEIKNLREKKEASDREIRYKENLIRYWIRDPQPSSVGDPEKNQMSRLQFVRSNDVLSKVSKVFINVNSELSDEECTFFQGLFYLAKVVISKNKSRSSLLEESKAPRQIKILFDDNNVM